METPERRDPNVGEGVTSVALADRLSGVDVDRRWLGLLLVIIFVLLGAGIAGLSAGQEERGPRESDVALSVSTPTPTPTPTDDGPAGAGVPGGSVDGPTPDDGPATSIPDDGGVQTVRDTASAGTATPTPAVGDDEADGGGGGVDDGSSTSGDASDVDVQIAGSQARLTYADVVPGTGGREELSLENVGNGTGRLLVTDLTVRDEENGVGDPEAVVDDTPAVGELSEHVLVALEVEAPDGRVDSLFGTGSGARSLASLSGADGPADAGLVGPDEEATLVVDWYVPASTGNEIQGDEVRFDLTVGLRADRD